MRGLSDWCDTMPGYSARHMAGSRYAVNRSIRQLVDFTEVAGAMRFPLRPGKSGIFTTFAEARRAGEQFLPPEGSELRGQLPLRRAFLEHLAGQNIAGTLKSVRTWFEERLPAGGPTVAEAACRVPVIIEPPQPPTRSGSCAIFRHAAADSPAPRFRRGRPVRADAGRHMRA